jgi:hypothetical protein
VDGERKLGATHGTEARRRCVNICFHGARGATRVAHERTHNAGDRARSAAGVSTIQNKPLDFEGALAGRKVDPRVAVLSCPWARPAMDLADRVATPGAVITP